VLVWRRTRSHAALIWLGLQPVFGAVAINGGHNDVVVGVAILGGVVAASVRRPAVGGVALGVAALIKLTAGLAVVGLGFWLWRRGRRRDALVALAAWAGTLAIGYVAFLGDATHVLAAADHTVTPASAWNGLVDLVLGHDAGRAWSNPIAPSNFLDGVFLLGAVTVVVVAGVAGWAMARRSATPGPPVGTTTAAYTMGAQYTFPWYAAWALPCFAESAVEPLGWLVWIQATVMLAALKLSSHPNGTPADIVFRVPITYLAPPALLVSFVVVATLRAGTGRRLAPS
jgi:alpha-1,6-mannosyltransferase